MVRTRRAVLASGALLGVGALAGCLGGGASGDVSYRTVEGGLQLASLDVGGSPGGQVPVPAADTATLVDFFATWCGPCRPQMDNLRAVRDRFGDGEFYQVSVTTETDEDAIADFWTEYEGTWPVALDPSATATQRFAVRGIPTLVVLDAGGTEVWRHRGLAGTGSVVEQVEAAIAATEE